MPDDRTPEDEGREAPPAQDADDERPEGEAGWAAPHLPTSSPQSSTTPPGDPPPPWSTPGPTPGPPPTGQAPVGEPPPAAAWTPGPTAPAAPPPFTPTPPRPRRRRRWPWVLGGVLGLIVVLLVVGIVVFVQKILPPVDAANDYLGDLRDRDYDAAFDRLCEEEQIDSSPETLRDIVESEPALSSGIDEFDVDAFNVDLDGDRADVDVDLDPDDFRASDFVLIMELVKEDGEWRPCGDIAGFR